MAETKKIEREDNPQEINALAHALSRRGVLAGAAGAGAAGALGLTDTTGANAQEIGDDVSVPLNGNDYDKIPLKKDVITVAAVQSRVRSIDGSNPKPGMRANLDHMLELIDNANGFGGRRDLLCFHEFPLSGWAQWSRQEIERLAIEIPGEETEEISKKAREYGCYIKFGSYAKDKDWPGHILSVTSIINPEGEVIAKDWKARNIKGVFPGFELFTTTVYNVLDQYIEMYGVDAVIPVTRTDIGNLSGSSAQREPELFRCMALKGCELLLRTATGGFEPEDIRMMAYYNSIYSLVVNNAVSPDNPGFFDDQDGGAGGSAIYSPRGETLAMASSKFEQAVVARLPMAAFRKTHKIPDVHLDLYMPVLQKYQPRFASGLYSEYLPEDLGDAANYLKGKDRWSS